MTAALPFLPFCRPSIDEETIAAVGEVLRSGWLTNYAPIHLFTLYRERGFKEGMFPVAERIGRLTVTLPMFPAMTTGDVERVVHAVDKVLAT